MFAGPPQKAAYQAYKDASEGKIPERRADIPIGLWYIMKQCWNRVPEQRPTACSIVTNLRKICQVQANDSDAITECASTVALSSFLSSSATSLDSESSLPFACFGIDPEKHIPALKASPKLEESAISPPTLLKGDQTSSLSRDDIIVA